MVPFLTKLILSQLEYSDSEDDSESEGSASDEAGEEIAAASRGEPHASEEEEVVVESQVLELQPRTRVQALFTSTAKLRRKKLNEEKKNAAAGCGGAAESGAHEATAEVRIYEREELEGGAKLMNLRFASRTYLLT